MSTVANDLLQFLAADSSTIRRWERSVFDDLAKENGTRLVLCGAGGLGRKTLAGLQRLGITPLAFADNDPQAAGRMIDGVQVLSAADATKKFGADATFVVTVWGAHSQDRLADRKKQWSDRGCETVVSFMSLFWKHAEIFLPHYSCDLPNRVYEQRVRIESLSSIWSDDASRAEFAAQVRWRAELDFAGLPEPVPGPAYFPKELFALRADERFVDCGAYDGDTLSDFLRLSGGNFEKYWALEPDPKNLAKLESFVTQLSDKEQSGIKLFSLAASDRAQTLRFSADATAASALKQNGNIEVEAQTLDEILQAEDPTFVKMDIEGAELSALHGAQEVLRRCRPILAICIYHLQAHLWEIPEWLSRHLRDYKFFLRPHDREGWDLVCYAVPRERALC